jgi:hypothetical protein
MSCIQWQLVEWILQPPYAYTVKILEYFFPMSTSASLVGN